MIGGIIMILVVLWVYQSAMRAKVEKVLFWVALCAVLFLIIQVLSVNFNIYLLEAFRGGGGDADYERDLVSVGDRKNEGGFQGFWGVLLSLFLELLPPVLGIVSVAFVRTKYMLKEELNLANMFSGIKELFIGIKDSFKTSAE